MSKTVGYQQWQKAVAKLAPFLTSASPDAFSNSCCFWCCWCWWCWWLTHLSQRCVWAVSSCNNSRSSTAEIFLAKVWKAAQLTLSLFVPTRCAMKGKGSADIRGGWCQELTHRPISNCDASTSPGQQERIGGKKFDLKKCRHWSVQHVQVHNFVLCLCRWLIIILDPKDAKVVKNNRTCWVGAQPLDSWPADHFMPHIFHLPSPPCNRQAAVKSIESSYFPHIFSQHLSLDLFPFNSSPQLPQLFTIWKSFRSMYFVS